MNPFDLIQRNKPPNKKRPTPRRGPLRDPAYLRWIRTLRCYLCARSDAQMIDAFKRMGLPFLQREPTEAAHVGQRGIGQKCSDRETIPLCAHHHRTGPHSHHRLGKNFWEHHGLNRDELIRELHQVYERRAA